MGLIEGIKEDIKGDIETVKEIATGEYKSNITKKDLAQGVKEAVKDPMSYVFLLLIIGAFISGIMFTGKYWQDKANGFAIDFCIEENPEMDDKYVGDNFLNFSQAQTEEEHALDRFVNEQSQK